jgi:acyl carrier protein phosphodiesterase
MIVLTFSGDAILRFKEMTAPMNYLAHSYLAAGSDEFLLGSFLGDFVKGKINNRYSRAIEQGIIFHRKVDTFADSHVLTADCRKLFSPYRRRFAGIIVDICYDHFLAKYWNTYASVDLCEFAEHVYTVIQTYSRILPPRLQDVLPRMRRQNWLAKYGTLDGVQITLERISKRISPNNPLNGSNEEVIHNYDRLESNFSSFFPDLIDFARSYCASVQYSSTLLPEEGALRAK